jgi:hypothetical protein
MQRRPVDLVTSSLVKLQRAQRRVDVFVAEVIQRVSADPTGSSSHPEIRVGLSELRADVDEAIDELIAGLERMSENST